MTIKEIWESIEESLSEIVPDYQSTLFNDGVSDSDVNKLEKAIGAKLPSDFIEFYKIHNGSKYFTLIYSEEFLSFDRMLDEWQVWKDLGISDPSDPEIGIKDDWWNPLWIPITHDGCGNHYCLDLDPTPEGNYGQIIRMWHDDGHRPLEASSFKEWMVNYATQLKNGKLVYSIDDDAVVPVESLAGGSRPKKEDEDIKF